MEIKKYFSKFLLAAVIAAATLLPCSLTFGMDIYSEEKYEETTEYYEKLGKENKDKLLQLDVAYKAMKKTDAKKAKELFNAILALEPERKKIQLKTPIKKVIKHEETRKIQLNKIGKDFGITLEKEYEQIVDINDLPPLEEDEQNYEKEEDDFENNIKKEFSSRRGGRGNRRRLKLVGRLIVFSILSAASYFFYKRYLKKKPVLPKKRWWSPLIKTFWKRS